MATNSQNRKNELRKYFVFALMGLAFAGVMWLIFAPSGDTVLQAGESGFNANLPEPTEADIVSNKETAYEQEQMRQKQAERMQSLDDFANSLGIDVQQQSEPEPAQDLLLVASSGSSTETTRKAVRNNGVSGSAQAYQDMNHTLGSFYSSPRSNNDEVQRLKAELEALRAEQETPIDANAQMDQKLALMEKSLQMASKYLPQSAASQMPQATEIVPALSDNKTKTVNGKTDITPILPVSKTVASSLPQIDSDSIDVLAARPVHIGFCTPTRRRQGALGNAIRAVVHDDCTVTGDISSSASVRIRLDEPMMAGGMIIPRNTILTGMAQIGGRLKIAVHSIEYQGKIMQTELIVYDADGQLGLNVPELTEVNAAKEIAASAGSGMGSSVTVTQSAGQQIAADLSRSAIQGVSQYVSLKMRQKKVHLKSGHQIFLLPDISPAGKELEIRN